MLKIETPRLLIREYKIDDKVRLLTALSDKTVMEYYPNTLDEKETEEWIERQLKRYKKDGCGLWAIELKTTGEFIGNAGLVKQSIDGKDEVEVGYLLLKKFWGKGYATEAARACMQHAFDVLKVNHIISIINPKNSPSLAVSRRNGMQFRENYSKFDLPQEIYSINRIQWKEFS